MRSWKQSIATVFAAVLVMLAAAVTRVLSQSPAEAPAGFATPTLSSDAGAGSQRCRSITAALEPADRSESRSQRAMPEVAEL